MYNLLQYHFQFFLPNKSDYPIQSNPNLYLYEFLNHRILLLLVQKLYIDNQ